MTEALKQKINANVPTLYEDCVSEAVTGQRHGGKLFMCHTCKDWLSVKHQMPPLCHKNGLELDVIPPELQLSDLSTVLIARTILFVKIFKLPKSRWPAIVDKVVNVPITDNDIIDNLSSLTSLPR